LTEEMQFEPPEIDAVDERVRRVVDEATEIAERSPMPEALDALVGVYADPETVEPLWFREGKRSAVAHHERAEGWGTFSGAPAQPAREND
jgi:hypothetical protein